MHFGTPIPTPSTAVLGLVLSAIALFAGEGPLSTVLPAPTAAPTAARAAQADAPAVLRFDPPTLDLGEMLAGQPKSATLAVTNVGDEPVTVVSMKGGCGCTTLGAHPRDPIAPGGSFSVEVTVDPGMRTGISLRKPVHVRLADGRVETMYVVGKVRTVIAVTPEEVDAVGSDAVGSVAVGSDAVGSVAGTTAALTLASVDGAPFTLTGSTPNGLVAATRPDAASNRFEIVIDLGVWEQAGRPPSIMLSTDRADAPRIAIPIRFADAVAMFRLPAAFPGEAQQESRQDALLREIDAGIPGPGEPGVGRSPQFRMRLHRESGMLFVHGTEGDIEAVRRAVEALPASRGVRESAPSPKG